MKKFNHLILCLSFITSLIILNPGCVEKSQNDEKEVQQTDTLENFIGDNALVITGILIDENGKLLMNESLYVYSGQNKTTLDTEPDEGGIKQIEGTGTISFPIEGIEGGGSIKLVDGIAVNPSAKTDSAGRFRIEVSKKFIEGETEIIITRNIKDKKLLTSKSLPIIDENGKPIKTKIEGIDKVLALGKIKTLKK